MPEKIGILTLGCKVNQYESEAIGERLSSLGYETAQPDGVCDGYIINTCTVTAEADRKSCQMIRRLIQKNPAAPVIVTGCTCQRSPARVSAIPGVYAVIGNSEKMKCAELLDSYFRNGPEKELPVMSVSPLEGASYETMRISDFPRTRQYVKIEDGCENRCAYCAIPDARGPVRSRPEADIIEETKRLIAGGCREIVLTGIETASYGKDGNGPSLAQLLADADAVCGGCRIRLGSVDPSLFRPEFVEKISSLRSLAPHFHVSMQSGSSRVLALMRRKYNAVQAASVLENLRSSIPDIMFTADMIVGFPGETEDDFEMTREFIKKQKFLFTHIFPFSPRKGTPAADMPMQLPQEEKHRRAAILAEDAQRTRTEILSSVAAEKRVFPVLFETYENGYAEGHTPNFIDVRVKTECGLHGETFDVRLDRTDGDFCYGEIVGERKDLRI